MIKIGIITGTQGVNGKLFCRKESDMQIDFNRIKSVSIGFSEKYSNKFKVTGFTGYKNGYLIQLKEINSKEKANKLKEQAVFISEKLIFDNMGLQNNSDITGYSVFNDRTFEKIGTVSEIIQMPSQNLIVVHSSTQETLIPYLEEFISSVDDISGKVFISILPGLLEINIKEGFKENDE